MIRLALLLFSGLIPAVAAWPNGYNYRRIITIDHTKVNGNLTNFPVLLAGTYPYLASNTNGGNVRSASGYDLVITSDASGNNNLNFERISWSPTSGAIVIMVNVPVLSTDVDTILYLFYGNAAAAADPQNKSAVWDNHYKGVYHLSEHSASQSIGDSTASAHPGTNATATANKSVLGPFENGTLGSALTYNGSSDWTDLSAVPDWDLTTGDGTLEFWMKPTALSTFAQLLSHGAYGSDGYYLQWANQASSPGQAIAFNGNSGNLVAVAPPFVSGSWYAVAFVKSGTTGTWYVNGTPVASGFFGNPRSSSRHLWLGRSDGNDSNAAVILSELRISNVARSSSWVATSYYNQKQTATFYSLGTEETRSGQVTTSSFITF